MKRIFNYIGENKKEILPNISMFIVLYLLLIVPVPVSKILLFWLYFPFAGYFFFRAVAQTEKDSLSLGDRIFICIITPLLVLILLVILSLIIQWLIQPSVFKNVN